MISDCVRIRILTNAIGNLLKQIEIDGSLIHSDECTCKICNAISASRCALYIARDTIPYESEAGT